MVAIAGERGQTTIKELRERWALSRYCASAQPVDSVAQSHRWWTQQKRNRLAIIRVQLVTWPNVQSRTSRLSLLFLSHLRGFALQWLTFLAATGFVLVDSDILPGKADIEKITVHCFTGAYSLVLRVVSAQHTRAGWFRYTHTRKWKVSLTVNW